MRNQLSRLVAILFGCLIFCNLAAADTVYDDLGGKTGVSQIINEFVKEAQQDERVKDKFKGVDTKKLVAQLSDQVCMLTGGPCQVKPGSGKALYEKLAIDDATFKMLGEDLKRVLKRLDVPTITQLFLFANIAPMKDEIITR